MSKGERGRQIAYASGTPDVRDMRDPLAIGQHMRMLRETTYRDGCSCSFIADICGTLHFSLVPEADGHYVGPLDRYGDPRARHREAK
jgi:hypothetical protein